jgi:hypothetical protein
MYDDVGVTAHTTEISVQVLQTTFPGRPTSHFMCITCCACLPDLEVPDYFYWSYIRRKVHETNTTNIDNLKQ